MVDSRVGEAAVLTPTRTAEQEHVHIAYRAPSCSPRTPIPGAQMDVTAAEISGSSRYRSPRMPRDGEPFVSASVGRQLADRCETCYGQWRVLFVCCALRVASSSGSAGAVLDIVLA